ncbi:DNA polymerase X family [Lunatimonas lonarensis]|uniref:DNA polymerase X family n=1 Tax=Lunatimonas lonarensis TaxID=1232681 RepID=R7ZLV8_9BACT|nr:DNA polymerase/3'-5' exonuclease PolX [Lunatimonas lonarensis]EON75073.1 DNA polymerase X family [Lunatimonas lonarensis]
MDNKQITKTLKLTIQLMELHEENSFKIRSYQSAVNTLDREAPDLFHKSSNELQSINGIGKSIAEVILEIIARGSHKLLDELLEKTPEGILEVLTIKGLGPKKIKTLWQELQITSTHELMEACRSGQVAKLKGFGEKTQESIIASLEYIDSNKGKWLYADIEEAVDGLMVSLTNLFGKGKAVVVGQYSRKLEIISLLEILIESKDNRKALNQLGKLEGLNQQISLSSPYRWGGILEKFGLRCDILLVRPEKFVNEMLLRKASRAHLSAPLTDGNILGELFLSRSFQTEEDAYREAGMCWVPEELREGLYELEWAKEGKIPKLLELGDLKGPLHNHSTYSDGKHSLREMADFCISQGYEYLGMADHSKSAFYANGLDEDRVAQQQKEIDSLNASLAPFKLFKGIESDILIDGSLDYSNKVLESFDYVVASVHSSLGMDRNKATARLLKAIQNPFTTILGHPTGRLLLRRQGYPIDHKAIIDACAIHGVVIEINANPWRLDLDWRWVNYAISQGVKLSINPDAHETAGFADMKYGVMMGRKGGLTPDMTLNTLRVNELDSFFQNRKKQKRV